GYYSSSCLYNYSIKNPRVFRPGSVKEVMLKAAELWAEVRNKGKSTADNKALDGDVILAAQSILVANYGNEVIIATSNKKHLSLFIDAREWQEI
ncbi:hypothetical protein MEN98_23945, partial [Dolichospermum sp. ST_sed8]|nr:hypothetical protein [Dolichospermum sp. ST_sed9]MDD1449102.1 hypothetical protein [Dolichospermum sp. ST_sed8]MDD1468759.1 hypothetical protein [Dolichospermum sp. ST_sed5]MDD1474318.1 hypothetical protein [Dolichospermum sp. ST_sed4]